MSAQYPELKDHDFGRPCKFKEGVQDAKTGFLFEGEWKKGLFKYWFNVDYGTAEDEQGKVCIINIFHFQFLDKAKRNKTTLKLTKPLKS